MPSSSHSAPSSNQGPHGRPSVTKTVVAEVAYRYWSIRHFKESNQKIPNKSRLAIQIAKTHASIKRAISRDCQQYQLEKRSKDTQAY
ncbi:hypothetical protein TNCV_529361 [Trichonephila clavipes]|nr:hypothetical protein TNCV_529361 [Trichonephila clavipes]